MRFVNNYLTPMTNIVFEEGGTLDKYIGDAVMAFWGAPVAQEDHALRACRAAMRFLEEVERLRPGWVAEGVGEVEIGVGINTGPMVVGNMGSDVRFDYTVMGDTVNLASRLEGANKLFGTRVLLSEETFVRVRAEVCGRRLGAVRVRGKQHPTQVYELRHLGPAMPQEAEAVARLRSGRGRLLRPGLRAGGKALPGGVATLARKTGPRGATWRRWPSSGCRPQARTGMRRPQGW